MKFRIHSIAVVLAAVLVPSAVLAQASTGFARVDSGTYANTTDSSMTFSTYGLSDNGGPETSSGPFNAGESSKHAGLLGKRYIRGAYVDYGIDDPLLSQIDDTYSGWDIEFNTPNPWMTSDSFGMDFFGEFEHRTLSGTYQPNGNTLKMDRSLFVFGTRLIAFPAARVRPYATLGFGFDELKLQKTVSSVTTREDSRDSGFAANAGIEADLAANVAIRGDVEFSPGVLDDPLFEGSLILWPHESFFLRLGATVPFVEEGSPGVTLGGGLAF
ncbi:MAG: hypothetical protein O3B13_08285 [Planctomycetota bacterium]|nr:hypothetical protein [Planctomycetota bacterium]MDA1163085.1 hypothetical protein [Planctomycetota bacterium]